MTFERPLALALLAALPLAWWLHRARRSAEIVRVPSLLAFRGAAATTPSSAPKRSLDPRLVALLAALALLAVAAAGPGFGGTRPDAFYVVLDTSASMTARSCEAPARAAAALARIAPGAQRHLHPLTGPDTVTVVDAGEAIHLDARPQLADGLPQSLARHLDAARAEGFPGVVLVTDARDASSWGAAVVGPSRGAESNVAVASASLDGDEAIVAVRNYGPRQSTIFVVCADVRRELDVPAGGVATARFAAPDRGETAKFEIVPPVDDLEADDRLVVSRVGGAKRVRLEAAAPCPRLEAALRAAGVEIVRDGEADAVVQYGRRDPNPGDPGRPLLSFVAAGRDSRTIAGDAIVGHGELADVLPSPNTRLVLATALAAGEAAWSSASGSVVTVTGSGVSVASDPEAQGSDWHRDPSFPAFVAAALDHLVGGPDRLEPRAAIPASESDVVHAPPATSGDDVIRAAMRPGGAAPSEVQPSRWLALAAGALLAAAAAFRRA